MLGTIEEKGTIKRSSEGIPRYDGAAETFLQYKEEAYKYMMSFEMHKRYLAGPRLVRELEGVAKTLVRRPLAKDARWVDHAGGVTTLLEYLEEHLERPSLINASRYVNKFFFSMKRRRFESMTSWVNRHSEALWEATKAMKRVQHEYGVTNASYGRGKAPTRYGSSSSKSSRRGDDDRDDPNFETSLPFGDDGRLDEDEGEEEPQREPHRRDSWWSDSSWSWHHHDGWRQYGWYDPGYNLPNHREEDMDCFIPDFLVGYLLLSRSGLEFQERNNVLASLRGQFSVATVERSLKELWSDEDLMKRDKAKGHALFMDEELDTEDYGLAAEEQPDFGDDWESQEACQAAEEEAMEAAATMDKMRRTLRDARQRQHELRMGRQFYRPSWKGGSGKGYRKQKGSKSGGSRSKCLKCGGDHYSSECPKKETTQKGLAAHDGEAAEIVFNATEIACPAEPVQQAMISMSELIEQGKGIIDCGATSSLGPSRPWKPS